MAKSKPMTTAKFKSTTTAKSKPTTTSTSPAQTTQAPGPDPLNNPYTFCRELSLEAIPTMLVGGSNVGGKAVGPPPTAASNKLQQRGRSIASAGDPDNMPVNPADMSEDLDDAQGSTDPSE